MAKRTPATPPHPEHTPTPPPPQKRWYDVLQGWKWPSYEGSKLFAVIFAIAGNLALLPVWWFGAVNLVLYVCGIFLIVGLAVLLPIVVNVNELAKKDQKPFTKFLVSTALVCVCVILLFLTVMFCWIVYENVAAYTATLKAESPSVEFPDERVPVDSVFAHVALKVASPNPLVKGNEVANYKTSMDRWKEWIRKGCGPLPEPDGTTKEQALVVADRFKAGFDKNYKTITGKVDLADDFNLLGGSCFLVTEATQKSGIVTPIYRQMPFLITVDKDHYDNSFTLIAPRQGEKLFMILKVRKKSDGNVPTDSTSYGVSLKIL